MGITLTSKAVNSTYDSLLKLSDNDQLTGAFKVITDGLGNDTGISINNNNQVNIAGQLVVNSSITANSFVRSGGLSTQFLKADGSVDSNTYQNINQKGLANGYAPLDSGAKISETYLPDSVLGQVEYKGLWNGSTNTPTLSPSVTPKGHYYIVSVAGTFDGITYAIGDWIISDGTKWVKVDNTDAVTTVFGRIGAIVANESDYSGFYHPLNGDLAANADTATTLKTARLINGTSFNGSGNITTAIWGTTRTITIGDTAKSVSGGSNVAWSRAELGITKVNIDALNINADTLDGQQGTSFFKVLSGGTGANINNYTDNGFRTLGYSGYSSILWSTNAGGSAGTVQMEFEYNTPSRGFKIRNKTDNTTWSSVGWVAMTTANQGHINGTIWHSGNDGAGSGLDADTLDGYDSSVMWKKGADIPSGADLNLYTSDGYYHQNTNAGAAGGTNYPVAKAGMLSVQSDELMVYQTYQVYNDSTDTYRRGYYNGTWYSWKRVLMDDDSINADTLGTFDSDQFLRSDVADSATNLTVNTLTIGTSNYIKFANNDYIRYDDANGAGRFHFDSDGGTNNASLQAALFVGDLQGNASSASLLGNLNNTQFLRSDTSDTMSGTLTVDNDVVIKRGTTSGKQSYHSLYIGGNGLDSANSAIYIGNGGDGSGYGYELFYEGTGSGNNNKLKLISENLGTPKVAFEVTADGDVTFPNNVVVTGSINIDAADLNIGAANLIFSTQSTQAVRGLIWEVDGGFLSKIDGGGTNGGLVELYANLDGAITNGDVFRIKQGSTPLSALSIAGNGYTNITSRLAVGKTTAPSTTLDVVGSGEVVRIEASSTSGYITFRESTTARGYIGLGDNGAILSGATTDSISIRSNANLHLGAGGNNLQMTLDGTNVGIGTTSPDVPLEVVSASPANGIIADFVNSTNAGGTTAAIKLSNGDSEACDVILGANRVGANFGSDFFISLSDSVDGSNQERFRITEAGNVGIGTSSPNGKLDIKNATLNGGFEFFPDNSTDTNLIINYDRIANTYMNLQTRAATHQFLIGSTERLRIDSSGNVGIGTSSPSYKLDVVGNTRISSVLDVTGDISTTSNIHSFGYIGSNSSQTRDKIRVWSASQYTIGMKSGYSFGPLANNYAMSFQMNNDNSRGFWWGDDAHSDAQGAMALSTRGFLTVAEKLRVGYGQSDTADTPTQELDVSGNAYISGNVGIGTTSPAQKLDVAGIIAATGGNSTNWNAAYGWGNWSTGVTKTFIDNLNVDADTLDTFNSSQFLRSDVDDTMSGTLTLGSYAQNNPIQGEWYSQSPYTYTGGITYYRYIKIANLISATSTAAIEYIIKRDSNYPGVVKGAIQVSSYSSASMSVQHDQITGNGQIGPEVYIDNNRDVWIRGNGAAWYSFIRWRAIQNSGVAILDGSTYQDTQPANSTIINPGYSKKFAWNNASSVTEFTNINTFGAVNVEGNVGIGTSSPAYKLDVIGDGIRNIRSTAGWAGWFENTNNSSGVVVTAGVDSGDAPLLIRKQNGTELFSVRGDGTSWFSNGNVGIGTTSPDTSLTIKTGSSAGLAKISSDGNGARYSANGDVQLFTNNSAYSINFFSANKAGNLMRILNNGNVGIGTTTPVETLTIPSGSGVMLGFKRFYSDTGQVPAGAGPSYTLTANLNDEQGTTLTSQYQYKFYLTTTGTGTYNSSVYIVYRNSADTAWDVHRVSSTSLSSNHPELTVSSTSALIYNDHSSAYNVSYRVETSYTGQAKTSPEIFGSDYMWTRDFNNLHYMDGNVGIGTSSPSAKLDVNGSIRLSTSGTVEGGTYPYTTNIGSSANATSTNIRAGSTDKSEISLIGGDVGDRIEFKTNSTERLRIDSSGNVGIGTISPSAKLNVIGDIHLGSYSDASNKILELRTPSAIFGINTDAVGGVGTTISYSWANGGQGALKFNSAAGEVMRLDSTGNVGIGTSSPSAKMHIVGDTPLKIHTSTNAIGAKINFSDQTAGYSQNGTIEYVHADTFSYGSGNAFKFYGTESSMSFHFAGKGLFTNDVVAYYSDMRLKNKVGDIENPIDKIKSLSGFYYEPNEIAQSYGYEKERRLGLSAQEVKEVLPEAVSDAAIGDGYMSVDYAKLVPVLVEAIKEQQKQIDELKKRLDGFTN